MSDRISDDIPPQGSKIALVPSYLRMTQAAGQVKILMFLLKKTFFSHIHCMPIIFAMQGKCLFSDISRPASQVDILSMAFPILMHSPDVYS